MSDQDRAHGTPRLAPPPRPRHALREPVVRVALRTITPIYGGGVHPRTVDPVDVIRVPTVRGHLRWWWRALFGWRYASTHELFAEERKRWGGTGERNEGRRSAIAVELGVDHSSVPPARSHEAPHKTDVGYVLWPARRTERESAAECRPEGVELVLQLYVHEQATDRTLDLEDLDLPAQPSREVDTWARWLARFVAPRSDMFTGRLVVVDDDVMSFLLETATQIDARVRIDGTTGTVAQGALWYEESLPAETLLLGLAMADQSRHPTQRMAPEQVLRHALPGEVAVQLGGKASVGRGRCRVVMIEGEVRP